ncbi:hypothetical protein [Terrabacter carboxydivorans]|uniref:Uncharacterized protein n=1 Tax=Terrabacter carboxydivorans TaxID=619730 RepID=A0ABN3LGW1_9MICO
MTQTVGPVPAVGARRRPLRRWATFVVLLAGLVLLATWTQGWDFATAPLWSTLVLASLVAAAGAAATFVPQQGESALSRLGGSCATVDAVATVASVGVALSSARDGGTASLALVLAGFALARRATTPQGCGPDC